MGVYDSLHVKDICPNWHEEVEYCFKTKEFGLSYQEYHVGDYVDKANTNYFLQVDDDCPKCGHNRVAYIEIKKVESVIAELPEEWIDVVEDHLDYIIYKCTGEIV